MKTKTLMVALATLLIGSLCFWACQKELPLQAEPESEAFNIPGEYIVVFKDGVTDVPGLARQLVESHDGEISHIYQYAIKGFAAALSSEAVEALRSHPQIAWIEADQLALPAGQEMTGTQTNVVEKSDSQTGDDVPWNLDRIDQRGPDLDNAYYYNQTGKGVTVYIIGEGISPHVDFNGRLAPGWAPKGGSTLDHSDNGWSTGLAAVVGGTTYGVAKECTLVPIRVLVNPVARNIIAGLEEVIKMHDGGPAVALATFYSRYSDALDEAVRNIIGAGITFVAVGLNDETLDACSLTPSGTAGVITVGSTNQTDEITSSPLVDCIDIFAPGVAILSATNSSDTDTHTFNNHANMAAAHVAGVAALCHEYFREKENRVATPNEIFNALIEAATKGIVKPASNNPSPLNNNLLYSLAWEGTGNGDDDPPPPPNEPPAANFSFTTSELTVTFTDLSYDTDGSVVAWAWNFGDGGTSAVQHPAYTYAAAGTYTVTLTVTDNEGATGSQDQNVEVTAPPPSGNNPPTITTFDLSRSTAGPWHRAHIDWVVEDVDGDLANVKLELLSGTAVLESVNINVSGSNASGSNELRSRTLPTAVKMIVTDSKGNTVDQTKSY